MIRAEDFDFRLPPELIAQQARPRGRSRLLVLPRTGGEVRHAAIRDLPDLLSPGDCLVLNDTKVLPARLRAVKPATGARIEVLMHRELEDGLWEALARPARRVPPGTRLTCGGETFEVAAREDGGRVRLRFVSGAAARELMRRHGEPPLPPYIVRPAGTDWRRDRARYQTVWAEREGSVAAPTAGLHFSAGLLAALARRGVDLARVTLHVGWGTFAPLPEGDLTDLSLHAETYSVPAAAAQAVAACRARGGRVIACGTTAARALESAALPDRGLAPGGGETRLFVRPGYAWRVVDGLLTNFHLPRSSLLMLVCAFAGRERVLSAYAEAVRQKYHFYSYGDAMLLL